MHEVFEYPFPLCLQSHILKGRFFQESLSYLKLKNNGQQRNEWNDWLNDFQQWKWVWSLKWLGLNSWEVDNGSECW